MDELELEPRYISDWLDDIPGEPLERYEYDDY